MKILHFAVHMVSVADAGGSGGVPRLQNTKSGHTAL